ncbi:hypothetical protein ACFYO9_27170 [Streptomyces sp. NPDC005863]|uniref:hypothetical protein n=1 Tax=unclassified Streptomyces TaxID=2593676 RepID=UPI0033D41BCA
MWKPSAGLHETRYTVPSARHSTVAEPPVKRTVERSGAGAEEEGAGDAGVPPGDGVPRDDRDGDDDAAAKAFRTAPSSSGRLCAAPPEPSELANCQAPSAPAAVPTATHAAVTTAFRHFLMAPLCRIVS